MSNNFFDANGRCVTNLTKHKVYQKSRNYFQLDKKRVLSYTNNKIFNNLKNYLCKNIDFNETEFEKGDIFVIEPNETVDPLFLEDTELIIAKTPSEPNDKFIVPRC